ncbi:linear amide C-N hydrolase [Aquitalea sp. ASV15]|uniref:linear amide C-N hydrolase n=1 Tax=Aquitalea sp. ASV15 TaxID=2795104 RepID=UPI0018EA56A6|nr:linear amide C-N hydrolase [Aquitalea sp. ASV15]
MCTTFIIRDQHGKVYQGRTLEYGEELAFSLGYYPRGSQFASPVPAGFPAMRFASRLRFLSISLDIAADYQPAVAGLNEAGLTVNMNMFAETALPNPQQDSRPLIAVSGVASWLLASCGSCAEVRQLVEQSQFWVDPLPMLGNTPSPFHYAVFDRHGQGLVIEFGQGRVQLHDNPVGVMTNGPAFDWHLTHLDNYAFVSNLGKREQYFGSHLARTEDVGNAMAGLPADDTSSSRFVRAAYYAQFCQTPAHADAAVALVAKITNKFDRPRGATNLPDPAQAGRLAEEWTTFSALTDLSRGLLYIRPDNALNYLCLSLADHAAIDSVRRHSFSRFLHEHIGLAQPVL